MKKGPLPILKKEAARSLTENFDGQATDAGTTRGIAEYKGFHSLQLDSYPVYTLYQSWKTCSIPGKRHSEVAER
jgi:hypothetical protein